MNSIIMNYHHLEGAALKTNELLTEHLSTGCTIHSYLLMRGEIDIGIDNFVKISSLLDSYTKWKYAGEWTEVHDAFYIVKSDNTDIEVKTRVSTRGILQIEHTTQTILGEIAFMEPITQLGIGIHVRRATKMNDDQLPIAVIPHKFSIIKRRSFHIGSVGLEGDVFVFHVSERYTSTGRTKCEQMVIAKQEAVYEVCVECKNPGQYIEMSDTTTMSISMLLKMYDFISALDDTNSALNLKCVDIGPGTICAH
jgi:hypothetical protein